MNLLETQGRPAESVDEQRSVFNLSSYSLKVNQNFDEQRQGQSMFEFLKRRKRYAIEQQISRSRNKSRCEAETSRSVLNKTLDEFSAIKGIRQKKIGMFDSRDNNFSTLTSKKVTFREPETNPQPPATDRTFLQIVSPFKRRTQSQLAKNYKIYDQERPSGLRGKDQTIQKQNLITKIQIISKRLGGYEGDVNEYKLKSQNILTELLTLLSQISTDNKVLKKKVQEVKVINKALSKIAERISIDNPSQLLDELSKEVSDKLNIIESQLKKSFQSQLERVLQAKQQNLKNLVKGYQEKLRFAQKDIEALQKKIEKKQNNLQQKNNTEIKKNNDTISRFESTKNQLQRKLVILEEQNVVLSEKHDKLNQLCKQLERANRTLESDKSALLRSFEVQKEEIACRKQQYLIHQMVSIKKQYQGDIAQITRISKMKELQLIDEINSLRQYLSENKGRYQITEQTNSNQLYVLRAQIDNQTLKNDHLVKKLNLANDKTEIYWSALKGIKVLSTRLGFYTKLSRIFDDIHFSDQVAFR